MLTFVQDMVMIHTIQHPARIHDVRFCERVNGKGEVLFVGAEDKKLSIYDVSSEQEKTPIVVAQMIGHTNRLDLTQVPAKSMLTPLSQDKSDRHSSRSFARTFVGQNQHNYRIYGII